MSNEPNKAGDPDNKMLRIIGIGNPMRSDDGVGHIVIDLLSEKFKGQITNKKIKLEKYSDNLVDILHTLKKNQTILIIDAYVLENEHSNHVPGKILEFELPQDNVKVEGLSFSSHGLNPMQVINMAINLGSLPKKVYLYLVEGKNFEIGEKICPEVYNSAEALAQNIYLRKIY